MSLHSEIGLGRPSSEKESEFLAATSGMRITVHIIAVYHNNFALQFPPFLKGIKQLRGVGCGEIPLPTSSLHATLANEGVAKEIAIEH